MKPHYYLSPARILTFERCPRKYFYTYLLSAPPDFTPYFLYLGKLVHSSIAYVESTGRPFKPFLLDQLCQFHFEQEEEIKKVYDLALPLMANWERWRSQRQDEELRGIEKPFEILTSKGTLLKGRMDRISYEPEQDEWIVSDYKTGTSKVPRQDTGEDLQMRCYALALTNLEEGINNLRVELVYLRDNDVRAAELDPQDLGRVERQVDAIHDRISSTTHYPAKREWYCEICRYNERCKLGLREDGKIITLLKTLAESEDYSARAEAAARLGEVGQEVTIHALMRTVLKDAETMVRTQAALSLGKMGDAWTISSLIRTVRQEALTDEILLALKLMAQRSLSCR